jgi:hypothetical protein
MREYIETLGPETCRLSGLNQASQYFTVHGPLLTQFLGVCALGIELDKFKGLKTGGVGDDFYRLHK